MPTTRSQSGKEESPTDVNPASNGSTTTTSNTASGTEITASNPSTMTISTGNTSLTDPATTRNDVESTHSTLKEKRRPHSHRSGPSRKKLLAELEAEEELARLKLRTELAKIKLRKLRAMRAESESSSDEEEENGETEETSAHVEEWLQQSAAPQENEKSQNIESTTLEEGRGRGAHEEERPRRKEDGRGQGAQRTDEIPEHRSKEHEELRPARQPASTEIASLAAAITQAVRISTRDSPKYLQELPTFNGQCSNWLQFRAACKETEGLFSKTENVSRLRRSIKGTALEAVSSLLISHPEPGAIIEALERRFGRPDALATCEMEKVKMLPRLTDNPRDVCIFANRVANIVATVEALKKIHYLYNPEMMKSILEKLTPIMKNKWYDYAAKNKEDVPDLKRLATFLNEEADKCGAYAPPEDVTAPDRTVKKRVERTFTMEDRRQERCPACKQEHQLAACRQFISADINKRWEIVKKLHVCFRCLRSNHRRGNCRYRTCGQQGCQMAHHRLLHHNRRPQEQVSRDPTPREPEPSSSTSQVEEVVSTVELTNSTSDNTRARRVFLKIAPVTLTSPNGSRINTYALLDDGSTVTIVDETITEALGISGPTATMWIQGVSGAEVKHEESKMVNIKIRGRYSSDEYTLHNARTVRKLNFPYQTIGERDIEDCAHLRDLKQQLIYAEASPKILIGQDNWDLLVSLEVRAGQRDQPVASYTRLGWVLHGCRTSQSEPVGFCGHIAATERHEEMETMMKKFFDLESLGVEPRKQKNEAEERALKILEERSRRLPDGHFETGLLWKEDNMKIPNNYEDAYKWLKNLEKKLDRDPELKKKYEERVENLLTSGYATTAPTPEKTWYLPHFAVVNPAKPKIRLVHDAAARSFGRSLNDMLLPGPDLLQSLPGVIMRFRQHPYAISADIKEMFMQIKIREEDRDALRFLWRGNERGDVKPQEYQMTSVIFRATSSPCMALYIKNKNAADFAAHYPEAVKAIERNHYMDDYICSFPTKEEAKKISCQVNFIHRQASFELRSWVSNEPDLVGIQEKTIIPIGGSETEKTLGLLWDTNEDCIGFQLNKNRTPARILNNERPPTKREALSIIMSLFDPLGLISPITTPAKRIMQETWRYGTGWDEPLPAELQEKWTAWLENLRAIETLRIPRCYDVEPTSARELHTFVDASEEAYTAATYIRTRRPDGSLHIALAAAKSRVTPLKPVSIPRLELQAAVLGTRLAKTVATEHDFDIEKKIYWSDSRTVLSWIRAEPRDYKTFVAHRLAEIEENTKKNEWRWLPSKENVADDATRATPIDFSANHRWFQGPTFLKLSENEWPTEKKIVTYEATGEERERSCLTRTCSVHAHLPSIERFSKWIRLIRTTARVLQFIELCRRRTQVTAAMKYKRTRENSLRDPTWTKKKEKEKPSTATQQKIEKRKFITLEACYITQAEVLWVRAVQSTYESERERIIQRSLPPPSDRLSSLSVFIDADGLLRLQGRISATPKISKETACPAILDGHHRYTKMYIQNVHEKLHHGGVETVVNEIRQRFWITRIRPTVRGVLKSCLTCRLKKAKPTRPATRDLPPARLSHHARPFTFTGLDYFGPLEVTVGRHHEKRYVALFTCMTSRAIHLEVAASLSADSAIAALRRFIARRGVPKEMWSDNATCFKAADKELTEEAKHAAQKNIEEEAASQRIQWRYIVPGSPFQGGVWERMVRSVKEALRETLHQKYPSDETLHTLLLEVENTVNSRPLTHVAVTPDEPEALTPNHILLGPNSHVPAPGVFTEDLNARKHWRRAQRLADIFWSRWIKEYLPTLQNRREPRTTGATPKIGDLVIICDQNLPRNTWPRGRITRVYPGKDNEVRVVEVTTRHGHTLKRPTKKIVVLPVESQDCEAGECARRDLE